MISNPPKGNSDKEIGANFAPLSVAAQQTPDLTVAIRAGSYLTATGEHKEYNGGNATIITAAGAAEWALVFIAANGTLGVTQQLATVGLPTPGEGELPLAAVYVRTAVATIKNDDIHDVRPLFVAQGEIVVGGIQNALDAMYSQNATDNLLDGKADLDGTTDLVFELGQLTAGSDIDLVAGLGTIRYNFATSAWQISNDGVGFADIGTTVGDFGTLDGVARDNADLTLELDAKADLVHTHVEADITDLQAYLLDVTSQSIRTMNDVEGATAATEDQVLAWDDTADMWTPRDRTVDNKATWGNITGTLSGQLDLQAALDTKTTKISNPGAGNLVKVDALGVLLDSGVKDTDFEPADAAIQTHLAVVTNGNPHGTDLADLASVTLTGPVADQVLTFDGAKWINQASPFTEVNDLSAAVTWVNVPDVNITETSVTQHGAALAVTASQVSDFAAAVAAEPVTDATDNALDLKADIASPVFAGVPVMPSYTTANLVAVTPAPTAGGIAFATDANAGSGAMCYGDGTIWRDIRTNLLVAV